MLDDVNDGTFTSSTATALAFLRTLGPRRYLHHPATGLALTTKDIGLATKDHKITDNDDSTFTIQVLSPARVWMFAPNGHKASHFSCLAAYLFLADNLLGAQDPKRRRDRGRPRHRSGTRPHRRPGHLRPGP